MDNKTPLLRLQNVTMEFAGKGRKSLPIKALENFSLDIMPGDVIAVVGESGCGKTTIGKIINDLYTPSSGIVEYNGRSLKTLKKDKKAYKEYRLSVQMVHQDSYAALNPSRTIFQSLCSPLLVHGIVEDRLGALDELVKLFTMVGLTPPEDFLFKFPHQLSGGQRQRVLLARALSVKPKLIVADEPVSMVDVSLRIELLNLINQMNRELGVAFIYITHDLATARYVAQDGKIMVMYLGKAVEYGNLEQVLRNPRHPYLQALLSAIPSVSADSPDKRIKLLLKDPDEAEFSRPDRGCPFYPRCLYATEKCNCVTPELTETDGCIVACHHVQEVPKWQTEK